MRGGGGQDQNSRVFHELCGLVLSMLKSPNLPLSASSSSSVSSSRRTTTTTTATSLTSQVSPAGFASLLLGVSLALMLCGSVTFVIGFILMPWVLGLVMVLYLAGIVSNLSNLGRAILYPTLTTTTATTFVAPPPPSRKELSASKYF